MNSIYWMNHSIEISKKSPQTELRVGAVLVSEHNELICSAYTGEEHQTPWNITLMKKIKELGISAAQSIYITINTISSDNTFDLNPFLITAMTCIFH